MMRGKFSHFKIISVHTPSKGKKDELIKDSFYNILNHIYPRTPVHDTVIIVVCFNAKIGR
jgi:hypothetical protein